MITWQLKSFTELTSTELYEILRLRQEVFVLEQTCLFMDLDHKDEPSLHLMGHINNELGAYSRLVPAGAIYSEVSIGRIVTSPKYRKQNYGRELMDRSIAELASLFGPGPIRIMAQEYLQRFYEGYGFVRQGESFLEDGIPHIYMLKAYPV